MKLEPLLERLATGPTIVRTLASGLSDDDARWRPDGGGWSVLEIVNHLADEERLDFRARLRSTLEDPSRRWTPIDPEGDVARKAFNRRDLAESLDRFERERTETLAWLRSLEAPDWTVAHEHPRIGRLRAGDLLASLAAHDAIHLRQLARRLLDLARRDSRGFETRYAGDW